MAIVSGELGVHENMKCRARINLILALAKWHELKGVDFAIY